MKALRHNEDKPHLSQLFWFERGLNELAAHCEAGRDKYPDVDGAPNWTLGGKPDQEYLDSATRHLASLVRGDTHDVETGTHHAAAVAWNMLAMLTLNYDDTPVSTPEPLTYNDVKFRLSTDPFHEEILPEDWWAIGGPERYLARSAGFVEQIDGSAVRS
jgi:hypothetical protein